MPKSDVSEIRLGVEEIASRIASLQSLLGDPEDELEKLIQLQKLLLADLPPDAGGTSTSHADWASVPDTDAEKLKKRVADLQQQLEALGRKKEKPSGWEIGWLVFYTLIVAFVAVLGILASATQGNAISPDAFNKEPAGNQQGPKPPAGPANTPATNGAGKPSPDQPTAETAGAGESGSANAPTVDLSPDAEEGDAADSAEESGGAPAGDAESLDDDGPTGPEEQPELPASGAPQDTPAADEARSNEAPSDSGAAAYIGATEQPPAASGDDSPETAPAAEDKRGQEGSPEEQQVSTPWVLVMFLFLGAFGGALRLIGSLSLYIAEGKLYRSWLPYYYLMPLEGAMLAFVVCFLVIAGIFDPGGQAGNLDAGISEGGLLALYALAAFTGLFAKNAMRKLKDLADTLFAKPSTQDAAE